MHLSKMLSGSSLNEKENDKHVTDRFIPVRRTTSNRAEHFGEDSSNQMDRKPKRGEEIGEAKVTLD